MDKKRIFTGKRFILWLLIIMVGAVFCVSEPALAASKKPSKVKSVKVTQVSYNTATIGWRSSKYAKKYVVYRATKKKGKYKKTGTSKTTTFTDKHLKTGSSYWYKVRAVNGKKKSSYSSTVKAVPALNRPQLIAVSTGDGPSLRITAVSGADGYKIYRDGKLLVTRGAGTYVDTAMPAGSSAVYKVIAYRKSGKKVTNSKESASIRAMKQRPALSTAGAQMVPTLKEGNSFALTGRITSNATIRRVEIGIVNAASNSWVSGSKYDNAGVNAMSFDLTKASGTMKFKSLSAGSYRYRIYAHLLDGTLVTVLNHPFTVQSNARGAAAIVAQAKNCAWAYGTSKSKYAYPGGSATAAFKTAIEKAYPNRSSWGTQTRKGASCDVFVGTVVRSSGYDTKFPRGLDGIEKHIAKYPDKWMVINMPDKSQLKAGDLLFQLYKGGGGHVMVYLGGDRIANAHYNGKTYGVIQSYSSQVHKKTSCQTFKAFRPRQ